MAWAGLGIDYLHISSRVGQSSIYQDGCAQGLASMI